MWNEECVYIHGLIMCDEYIYNIVIFFVVTANVCDEYRTHT